jgi:hypothetical protein
VTSEDIRHYQIRDSIIAKSSLAVAFHLHTPGICEVEDGTIHILGKGFSAYLEAAHGYSELDCFEDLIDYRGRPISHILLTTDPAQRHDLAVNVTIESSAERH